MLSCVVKSASQTPSGPWPDSALVVAVGTTPHERGMLFGSDAEDTF
jgi:hypothetical protein